MSYHSGDSNERITSPGGRRHDNHLMLPPNNIIHGGGRAPASIDYLFAHHNWNHIRTILKTPCQRETLCQYKDEYNTPSLALAMGFLPPLDIIQLIYQINPVSMFETDDYGANALQIACLNGASFECIDYILSRETESNQREDRSQLATKLNHVGECALHHAVEFACLGREETLYSRAHFNTSHEGKQSYLNVIYRVIWAAPEMMNARDKESNTPIDLVQFMKSNTTPAWKEYERLDEIYQLLLTSSIVYYRRRKVQWEEEGYHEAEELDVN